MEQKIKKVISTTAVTAAVNRVISEIEKSSDGELPIQFINGVDGITPVLAKQEKNIFTKDMNKHNDKLIKIGVNADGTIPNSIGAGELIVGATISPYNYLDANGKEKSVKLLNTTETNPMEIVKMVGELFQIAEAGRNTLMIMLSTNKKFVENSSHEPLLGTPLASVLTNGSATISVAQQTAIKKKLLSIGTSDSNSITDLNKNNAASGLDAEIQHLIYEIGCTTTRKIIDSCNAIYKSKIGEFSSCSADKIGSTETTPVIRANTNIVLEEVNRVGNRADEINKKFF